MNILSQGNQQERTEAMNKLKSEMMAKVGTLEKWRWIMIGGSIVVGFILHKIMNFSILIS